MKQILEENARRVASLRSHYDPMTGVGCAGERVEVERGGKMLRLPARMVADEKYRLVVADDAAFAELRMKHDFEYWAACCVTVKDKVSGMDMRLRLNRPQRRVLCELEKQRLAGKPIRMIMLKARQWGGSTLIQTYMAWIQCLHRRNWNSLICAHVKDTSATIRGMYTKLLANYPEEFWLEDAKPCFKPFERSVNTRVIEGRGCMVTVGSCEGQEAVRGGDYAMAHLSEVAFWPDTVNRSPEGFIRAVCGGIARVPLSLIVLESTANGVGNFFHNEWLRSVRGESDKVAVFVPWYEIDIYSSPVDDAETLWTSLDDYEKGLWERGCTLEQICWYRGKRREYPTRQLMAAEYPTDDVEAFANTGNGVFDINHVDRLRSLCREAPMRGELAVGAVTGIGALDVKGFVEDAKGALSVWKTPAEGVSGRGRYVVAVDVGGRSAASDYSVIAVIDRFGEGGLPEVAAQWRGHIDHDLLAWKAASIASWYCGALLVIESNTLETEHTDGDPSLYILTQLSDVYRNLYYRESGNHAGGLRVGFHTNRATKSLVICHLIGLVRESAYIERDAAACDEMVVYECGSTGVFGAKAGYHDDILMTRAIGLYVASTMPPPIKAIKVPRRIYKW
ncbi:MAG: hypothetical protein NC127_06815 [Muribaculum sp.]|nr:hypothetical protein [Muribaculum sp.]